MALVTEPEVIGNIFVRDAVDHVPFVIFEVANNHMGSLEHAVRILDQFSEVAAEFDFRFAFKLQLRDIDSFIHPAYRSRMDIPYVKRFSETRLSEDALREIRDEIGKRGHLAMCTPFDEPSVDLIEKLNFDILKVGSCSCTDWPLLERVAASQLPVIVSTAGADLAQLDNVVAFLRHRRKQYALMHCVGAYPTTPDALQLNQIDLLRGRYPEIPIGYSTHEEPGNFEGVKIAYAKGAQIFEKHVAVATDEYSPNAYSITPDDARQWLRALDQTRVMCGVSGARAPFSAKEKADLRQFQRGAFASRDIKEGEIIGGSDVFLAFPNGDGQLVANDLEKYVNIRASHDILANEPIDRASTEMTDTHEHVRAIMTRVHSMLAEAHIAIPDGTTIEISHHYGINRFDEYGACLVGIVNRDYCKKLIVQFPGQKHPVHAHRLKEETFHILVGEFTVTLDGREVHAQAGQLLTVERGVRHSFSSETGGIFEEISTADTAGDSYYEDPAVNANAARKTRAGYWREC